MQLRPVPANEWVTWPPEAQKLMRELGGAVPTNDVFIHLWQQREAIRLLYGSYGSGKSVFEASDLVEACRTDDYFKCYFGRKVFDTVRGSIFDTICDAIEDMRVQHEFHYNRTATSSMLIKHVETGNTFVPFGSDKAAKLKSIKDPTHIICEEFDQFDELDFQMLYPRLRTTKAKTQFVGMFNTAAVFPNHWILKLFFPDLYEGDDKPEFEFLEGIEINKVFANYTDNYFIDQEAYYAKLKLASGGNDNILQAIANGAWGVTDNKNPWLYAFDHEKHVAETVPFLRTFPVYLSFDFNNDPFACTAWQMSPHKGGRDSFIHGIKEFSGYIKVEEMCARIRSAFPYSILHITGDRNGQNEDIGRNQSLYKIIASLLQVPEKLLDTNTQNLTHADSRVLLNTMLANYPNVKLSRDGMPNFIRQCQNAKVDLEAKTPSALLKDRGLNKNDEFDSGRYFFQTYFNKWAKETYFRARKRN